MSWLFWILLIELAVFAIRGYRKGMVRTIISMVSFFIVTGVAVWLNPYVTDFIREKTNWQTGVQGIAFAISFLLTNIIVNMILYAVDILTELPVIGTLNRIGGMTVGIIQGILWIEIFFLVVAFLSGTEIGGSLLNGIGQDPVLSWLYDKNYLLQVITDKV